MLVASAGAVSFGVTGVSTAPLGRRQWYWQNPKPQGNTILSVAASGDATGWAAGALGTVLKTPDRGRTWLALDAGTRSTLRGIDSTGAVVWAVGDQTVRVSSDGGTSWAAPPASPGPLRWNAVDAPAPSVAWLAGAAGALARTSDGGASWTVASVGTGDWNDVCSLDGAKAWAVGSGGAVARTTDGGASWTTVPSGVTSALRAVRFVDTQVGWAVGDDGVILATTDGGTTWTRQAAYAPGGAAVTSDLRDVAAVSASTAWIVGDDGVILATTDGGITWRWQYSDEAGGRALNGIAAFSPTDLVSVGDEGETLLTNDGGATWDAIGHDTTLDLLGATFTGPTSGICVGRNGVVTRTDDLGMSWSTQYVGAADWLAVAWRGTTHGWIAGSGGAVARTTDGGVTWTVGNVGSAVQLNSVAAATTSTIVAVGNGDAIFRSIDGGATWVQVPGRGSPRPDYYDIFFVDQNVGYIVGSRNTILKTTNGGASWIQLSFLANGPTLRSVCFVDASTGWVVGSGGVIRKTTNGGATWVAQPSGITAELLSVAMADDLRGWAVGAATGTPAKATVLRTTNGGATWVAQDVRTGATMRAITAAAPDVAGMCGDRGVMRVTLDGGQTWLLVSGSSYANNRGVAFSDPDDGWVVGDGGSILRTYDGGATWSRQVSGVTVPLNAVEALAGGATAWAVGGSGTLLKTTDGGRIWASPGSTGTTQTLDDVEFVDASTGWVVGAGGVRRKTTNGGSSWTAQISPAGAADLDGVAFRDAATGVAVGAGGTVIRTADGGSSWTTASAGTLADLRDVAFVTSQTVVAVGTSGAIVRSTDAGSTWSPVSAPTSATLHAVDFLDASSGYAVGETGPSGASVVLKTADGGQTWSLEDPGTYKALRAVDAVDATSVWVAGDGGAVLARLGEDPPVTTIVTGEPDGEDGWYGEQPIVEFVTDKPAYTFYSWDSASGPWSVYALPFAAEEGTRTLWYFSEDAAGNREPVRSHAFRVDLTPPSAPGTPTAETVSAGVASFSWTASSDSLSGLSHYRVLVDGSLVATSPADETSCTVSGLATDTPHAVEIVAVDRALNESPPSPYETFTFAESAPEPPSLVYARSVTGARVMVDWVGATGTVPPVVYRVWRRVGSDLPTVVAEIPGDQPCSWVDTAAPSGVAVGYAVSTIDARGEGALSADMPSAETTVTLLRAPGGLQAEPSTGAVGLAWAPLDDPRLGALAVIRCETPTATAGTTLAVLPAAESSFVDSAAVPGVEYWYRLVAVDMDGRVGMTSAPAVARADATDTAGQPHGPFTNDGDLCGVCHAPHLARNPLGLLTKGTSTDAETCFTCHDGTTATDVLTGFADPARASRHPVEAGSWPGRLDCSRCHAVHGAGVLGFGGALLRSRDVTSGPEYCYTCHGPAAGVRPTGDTTVFTIAPSAHATAVAAPAGSSGITCLRCHAGHSVATSELVPIVSDERCLGCHGSSAVATGSADIADALSGPGPGSRHDLLSSDQAATGARIQCRNCHDAHAASAATPVIDPDDPARASGLSAGAAQSDAFCLKCHDAGLPTSEQTTGWVDPPLAAGGLPAASDIASSWASSVHGAAAAIDPQLRVSMGYQRGDAVTCQACHSQHGSHNRWGLRTDIPSRSGTSAADGLLVYPIDGGGADLRFWCSSCHTVIEDSSHPTTPAGGADLSVFPVDCTECHRHGGRL